MLSCLIVELLHYWNMELLTCWIVKLLNCRIVEVSKCWIVELMNCWIVEVELLKCWIVEVELINWEWKFKMILKMKFEVESTNWNWYLGFEVCIQKLKYHKFVFNNWSIISIVRRLWYISVSLENLLFCLGLVSLFVLKCLLRFLLPE